MMGAEASLRDPAAQSEVLVASGFDIRLALRTQPGPRASSFSHRRVAAFSMTRCGASGQPSPKSSVSTVSRAAINRRL